jgi:P27 family predicted phage terminase small subunit
VPELASLGLLTKVDRAALVNYCQWWARWVEAEKILTEHGLTFETPNGYVQQRPEVAIAQKAASILGAYLTRFGLSPSDRARLTLPEKPAADPFAEFLSRKGESANA